MSRSLPIGHIRPTVVATRGDAQTATAAVRQMATVVDAIDTSQRAILEVVEELLANTAGRLTDAVATS